MARGRMVNKTVSTALCYHLLPDDTCRMLALMIIPHLDKNGVFYADPQLVLSQVLPRRRDLSSEQISVYLDALQEQGLIVLFEAQGERWQWWPGFDAEQSGLHKERETTNFPTPPADAADAPPGDAGRKPAESRSDAGKKPAESRSDAGKKPAESRSDAGRKPAESRSDAGKKPVKVKGRSTEREDPPTEGANAPPLTLNATLQELATAQNPTAVLTRWLEECVALTTGVRPRLAEGRVGKLVTRWRRGEFRANCRLAARAALEVVARWPGDGEFLDYLETVLRARKTRGAEEPPSAGSAAEGWQDQDAADSALPPLKEEDHERSASHRT